MSTDIYHDPETGVSISTYAGPMRTDGGDRKRVQLTRGMRGDENALITFSKEEWLSLCEGLNTSHIIDVWTTP